MAVYRSIILNLKRTLGGGICVQSMSALCNCACTAIQVIIFILINLAYFSILNTAKINDYGFIYLFSYLLISNMKTKEKKGKNIKI